LLAAKLPKLSFVRGLRAWIGPAKPFQLRGQRGQQALTIFAVETNTAGFSGLTSFQQSH
jgi:hypothetical protein